LSEDRKRHSAFNESSSSSVFSRIAQRTMERKEKIRLMYSMQNGLTEKSMPRLRGYGDQPVELTKQKVRRALAAAGLDDEPSDEGVYGQSFVANTESAKGKALNRASSVQ